MSDIQKMIDAIRKFREARNWVNMTGPKDMALSLVLEASELIEHFQWKNGQELTDYLEAHREAVGDELADILFWVLAIGDRLDIDILAAHKRKMQKNEVKYPVQKARGSSKKYTEL